MEIQVVDMHDDFECLCGNKSHTGGFYPCDKEGNQVDPVPGWEGFYKCADCNQIYSPVKFEASQMARFIKKESLLAMVYVDLSDKNPKVAKESMLETIFNSYVLDDSAMMREYSKA